MATLPTYVVITPARNEAQFIELTIKSVVAQTVRPLKWVIVSDGSTDGTDQIVKRYAAGHPWIELIRMPERRERHFAGKVHAFSAGYARLGDMKYDVICSLDADISFEDDYFSFLLHKMAENPLLGLAGTPFREGSNQTYDYRFASIEHVSGACQLFRRQCFEEIGGYVPITAGGVDHFMVVSARMKGWKTRTFTDRVCLHHRPMGTAQQNVLRARLSAGAKDYAFGNHPVWELFRIPYQMTKPPLIIGAVMLLCGYLWATIRRAKRPVSHEFVAFTRREQMQRLKRILTGNRTHRTDSLRQPTECA
jgi:glycosyltransferase involved in cell wall biosynthesis